MTPAYEGKSVRPPMGYGRAGQQPAEARRTRDTSRPQCGIRLAKVRMPGLDLLERRTGGKHGGHRRCADRRFAGPPEDPRGIVPAGTDAAGCPVKLIKIGQAPAEQGIHCLPGDPTGSDGISVGGIRHRQTGKRWRHQQLISGKDVFDHGEYTGADDLVAQVLYGAPRSHGVQPMAQLRRQILGTFTQNIVTLLLEQLQTQAANWGL